MSGARRCLVIHPGALGDVLLALPALGHLEALGFDRTLAATPRLTTLLDGSGVVEGTTDFDGLGLHGLFRHDADPRVRRALAAYDAVVSWFGAGDPLYRSHLTGLGRPVVVARSRPASSARQHASRHLLETLAPLGPLPDAAPVVPFRSDAAARGEAGAWLRARGLGPGEPVVLHPGAASPSKVWPGFPVLARRLRADGLPVIVTTGPADGDVVARLTVEAGLTAEAIAGDWPLRRLAALFALARAVVGNDSGPSHLAAAVGSPTLVLFGPTDPDVWSPIGPNARVLAGAGPGAAHPWDGATVDRAETVLRELRRDRRGVSWTAS